MKITPARSASDGGEIVKIELVRQAHSAKKLFWRRALDSNGEAIEPIPYKKAQALAEQ